MTTENLTSKDQAMEDMKLNSHEARAALNWLYKDALAADGERSDSTYARIRAYGQAELDLDLLETKALGEYSAPSYVFDNDTDASYAIEVLTRSLDTLRVVVREFSEDNESDVNPDDEIQVARILINMEALTYSHPGLK